MTFEEADGNDLLKWRSSWVVGEDSVTVGTLEGGYGVMLLLDGWYTDASEAEEQAERFKGYLERMLINAEATDSPWLGKVKHDSQ